ncbi:hypothetical protein SETIT_6G002900v2 [Setaria italica]|uniref:Late embryogenesis abundant protein LEA-2 subgroup domain-containing protein n=2 Tax=Setaria italica TaxID=4555 RepID=A0A368RGQ2_SETIT|nr:NDR1/HIN1-like protein 10 [Setaria italica]RCV29312.1 hypothetical protein SETIT_6G002900v2 [Setaria italica]
MIAHSLFLRLSWPAISPCSAFSTACSCRLCLTNTCIVDGNGTLILISSSISTHIPLLQVDPRMGKASTVSSLLCCPCRCLFCGVLSCLFSVLTCIFFSAGLVALVLYLLFRPHIIRATAVSADLSVFDLTPRMWILHYNLSLALQLRNPNKRIALHYRDVAAHAYYEGQRLADAALPDFFQDTGETSPLNPVFAGDAPLVGGVAAAGFRREAAEGATFSVDVKITAHMKLKLWVITVPGPKPKIDCPLRIQQRNHTDGGAPPPEFHPTECRVWF